MVAGEVIEMVTMQASMTSNSSGFSWKRGQFRNDRLKALREAADITQDELEKALGIGENQLTRHEKNGGRVGLDTVLSYADYFKVSVDYLLNMSDDPYPGLSDEGLLPIEKRVLKAYRESNLPELMRLGADRQSKKDKK